MILMVIVAISLIVRGLESWIILLTTKAIGTEIFVRESTPEQTLEALQLELIKKAFQ